MGFSAVSSFLPCLSSRARASLALKPWRASVSSVVKTVVNRLLIRRSLSLLHRHGAHGLLSFASAMTWHVGVVELAASCGIAHQRIPCVKPQLTGSPERNPCQNRQPLSRFPARCHGELRDSNATPSQTNIMYSGDTSTGGHKAKRAASRACTCVPHPIQPAPSPPDAGRYTVPSRFRCQSVTVGTVSAGAVRVVTFPDIVVGYC